MQAAHGKHSLETVKISLVGARLCNELALSSMQRGAAPSASTPPSSTCSARCGCPTSRSRCAPSPEQPLDLLRADGPAARRAALPAARRQELDRGARDDVSVHVALNLTTVLADLGRHREALETAHGAVRSLTERARPPTGVGASGAPRAPTLLSAAYHNLAVQQERLGHTQGQIASYKSALHLVKRAGGDKDSPMVQFVQNAYAEAKRRAANPPPRPASAAVATAPPPRAPCHRGRRASPAARGRRPRLRPPPAIASPKPSVPPPWPAHRRSAPARRPAAAAAEACARSCRRRAAGAAAAARGGRGRQKTVEEVFLGGGAGPPSNPASGRRRAAPRPYGASNTAAAPPSRGLWRARASASARGSSRSAGPGRTRVRVPRARAGRPALVRLRECTHFYVEKLRRPSAWYSRREVHASSTAQCAPPPARTPSPSSRCAASARSDNRAGASPRAARRRRSRFAGALRRRRGRGGRRVHRGREGGNVDDSVGGERRNADEA